MDLSAIKPAPIEVPILNPGNAQPTGLVLKCISPHDASAAPARRALIDRSQRKGGATESDSLDFLCALVMSWEWTGDATWNGEKPTCTPANVRKVLAEPWVRVQLDEALGDTAAFFRQ